MCDHFEEWLEIGRALEAPMPAVSGNAGIVYRAGSPLAHVGDALGGEDMLPWSKSGVALNESAKQVNADATAWMQSRPDAKALDLWNRWTGWYVTWSAWFADHDGPLLFAIAEDSLAEYRRQETDFRNLLSALKLAGMQTAATVPDTRSLSNKVQSDVSDWFGANWGKVALVGLALTAPLWLPSLASAVFAIVRYKQAAALAKGAAAV